MKERYYAAYGSNLNLVQMRNRCRFATFVGTGRICGYELQFKGRQGGSFATVAKKENGSVPVGIWKLEGTDEMHLDRYEGFPSHYHKESVAVKTMSEDVRAMIYIMNPRMDFGLPSHEYFRTVRRGYKDCGFDESYLEKALELSFEKCKERYFDESDMLKFKSHERFRDDNGFEYFDPLDLY